MTLLQVDTLPRALAVGLGVSIAIAACDGADAGSDPATSASTAAALETRLTEAQEVYYRAAYDSAAERFEAIRAEALSAGDGRTEAAATMWLGLSANARGQWDSARILGEEAVALQRALGLDDLLPRAYNALGLLAWEEFRLQEAESLFVNAIDAAERSEAAYLGAVARGNLGLVQQDLGDFEGAREGYETQLAVAGARDSIRAAATSRLNLAILSIREGDARTAAAELRALLPVFEGLDDARRLQNTLAQLAEAYADLGEPRLAFAMLDSAIAVARERRLDVELARNFTLLASLHQRTGNLTRALEVYERSRAELQAMGLDAESAWALRSAAEVRARLGDVGRARSDAMTALAVHAEAGLPLEQIDDHLLLATLANRSGDVDGRTNALAAVARIANGLDDDRSALGLTLATAGFELDDGEVAAASRRLEAARPLIDRAPPALQAEALTLVAVARAAGGDPEGALAAGREGLAIVESIRRRFGSAERRGTYLDGRLDLYGIVVEALVELDRAGEAFAVADAARSRGVSARLASAAAQSPGIAVVAEGEQLLARIGSLVAQLDTASSPFRVAALHREVASARVSYERRFRDARELLGSDAAFLGLADVAPEEVAGALAPDEALVEYLVNGDRTWLFVVTRAGVRPLRSDVPAEDLAGRVRIARDLVADPESDSTRLAPVLGALHDLLLGPAREAGLLEGIETLTVVPHGALNYLPFPALMDRSSGRYLIEEVDVRYLPSAAALVALRERARTAPDAGAALFAPTPDALPNSRAEVERISTLLPGARSYVGRRANEGRVREALESGAWVHIASHAVMNARNPMFSRIELGRRRDGTSDDGRLEVHEVLDLRVRSALVFLSGCETGVGAAWATAQGRGEDQTTLERAFLYAGADNVIATLWPVDDRGAAELATAFYRAGLGGERLSARLARAQRSLLHSDSFSAPYYWAGYRLSGSDRLRGSGADGG